MAQQPFKSRDTYTKEEESEDEFYKNDQTKELVIVSRQLTPGTFTSFFFRISHGLMDEKKWFALKSSSSYKCHSP
jgi:hypothetical protein